MKKISVVKLFYAIAASLVGGLFASTINPVFGVVFGGGLLLTALLSPFMNISFGADSLNITDTSWSGPALDYMLHRMVVGADTVDKGVAHVMEDVSRKAWALPRVDVSQLLQAYAPTPISNGQTTVDARFINLSKFELYQEFNPQDFEQHYFEQLYSETRTIDETLPATAENFIMLMYMERLNQYLEYGFWNAHTDFNPAGKNVSPITYGYADNTLQTVYSAFFYNGFIQKMLNDATIQKVAYGASNTLPANIRADVFDPMITKLITNPISQGLAYKYGVKGLRFCVSYADQSNYELALQRDAYKNIQSDEAAYVQYRKYDVVPLAGLNAGTIVLTLARPDLKGNLFIGMNSTEDTMLDMKRVSNPSDLWYVKGIFRMDVNHGFGDQACLYTNITA